MKAKLLIAIVAVGAVALLGLTGCNDKDKKQDLNAHYNSYLKDKDSSS